MFHELTQFFAEISNISLPCRNIFLHYMHDKYVRMYNGLNLKKFLAGHFFAFVHTKEHCDVPEKAQ